MLCLFLMSICLISVNLPYINTVTVDNQNKAECFARIYKEAMIPPNRAFRTSETNSLRICRDLCIAEGKRCQSFALGISALGGGNGTCQLSSERLFENSGQRPRNTVYDPEFNLYQRKENCGIRDNNDMPLKDEEMPTMITIQTDMPSDRPVMPTLMTSTGTTNSMTNTNTVTNTNTNANANTMMSSSIETDRSPTAQTTADSSTSNDITSSSMQTTMNTISTNPTMSEKPDSTSTENQSTQNMPSTFSSGGSEPTTNMYSNTIDSTKMPSPPTIMTTMDGFPSTATTYGTTDTDLSTNEVKPQTYPTIYMTGMASSKPDDIYPHPPAVHNKYNYYHDMYPVYTYPTYYESSYTSGTSGTGGTGGYDYTQNTPTMMTYHPETDLYGGTTPSMTTFGGAPNTASTYMGNGWSNADEMNRRKQNGERYPDRDSSGSYPGGKYNGTRMPSTLPYIRTIFNPDFYLMDAKRSSNRNMNAFDMDSIEHHIIKREYSYGNANSNAINNSSSATDNKSQSNSSRSYRIYDNSGMGGLAPNSTSEKRHSAATSTLSTSLSSSTTIAAGKWMYVTCSNRGILDQGNIVRGTYFPPLATSQDHQNLGTVATSQAVSASSLTSLNYPPNHHMDHASRMNSTNPGSNSSASSGLMAKENNNAIIAETLSVASLNGMTIDGYGNYDSVTVTAPMPTYVSPPFTVQYKDYVNYHQNQSPTSNPTSSQGNPQHMVDEVDSREFEKYFKYPDTNHNFNEYDSNSAYHGHHHPNSIYHNHQLAPNALPPHVLSSPHHPATIAPQEYSQLYYHPNTNVPPGTTTTTTVTTANMANNCLTMVPPLTQPSQTVLSGTEIYVQNESVKDDEFSNILAGVRKTCYSN